MLQSEFTLLGDAVWLDFVNTSRGRGHAPPDLLSDSPALARWARAQNLDWDDGCAPSLGETLRFRERLTSLAEALHAGQQPPSGSIAAINEQLARHNGHPGKAHVQRFKGLGEMNPQTLKETTLDPRSRTLLRVTIEDAARTDAAIQTLMGKEVQPRFLFIMDRAPKVEEIDV